MTEVYHILQGSGTLVTGGTIVDATAVPSDSETHKVLVGPSTDRAVHPRRPEPHGPSRRRHCDPPGAAHWFSAVGADMNYLVVLVDGDHVLPAGYVNTAIKP